MWCTIAMKSAARFSKIIVLLLAILVVIFLISRVETKRMNIYLRISNYTGIMVDSSMLNFGTIPAGASVYRNISISNDLYPIFVILYPTGPLAKWTEFSDNYFVVYPPHNKSVQITIMPKDAALGNYSSSLAILTLKFG